jgi:hypothetical protein
VGAITSWRSREPLVMHLLRGLALLAMHFSFHLKAVHIPGISNVAADALSRNSLPSFFTQVPEASPASDPIPPALAGIFLYQQPDWLSSTCMLQHLYASAASVGGSCRVHSKVVCIRTASLPPVLPTSRFPPCPASQHQHMLFATFLSEQGLSW